MSKQTNQKQTNQNQPQRIASLGRQPEMVEGRSTAQKRKHRKRSRVAIGHQASYGTPASTMYQPSTGMTHMPRPKQQQRQPGQQSQPSMTGQQAMGAGLHLPQQRAYPQVLPQYQHHDMRSQFGNGTLASTDTLGQPLGQQYHTLGINTSDESTLHSREPYHPPAGFLRARATEEAHEASDEGDDGEGDDDDDDGYEEHLTKLRTSCARYPGSELAGGDIDAHGVFHGDINVLVNAFQGFIDTYTGVVVDYVQPVFEAFIDSNSEVVSYYLQDAFQSCISRMARSFASGTSE
ncbi:hypothetical protein LTR27_006253 [Elasticomyces elasticus]|nr:hypothetical protein LTR27_006253 [Elasticomyces elasticus]